MDIETNTGLETKAGIPPDAVVTHAEMMRAFEEFKETNDKQLAGIERRRVDVLLNEKLARIDQTIDAQARRLDEITLKSSRPIIAGERLRGSPEHKMAFEAYVRSGEDTNLRTLEWKALSAGSNQDGGFLVPSEVEGQISQRLIAISPIRAIAGIRTISSNV
jgi:HK97 family phage major capsid protein